MALSEPGDGFVSPDHAAASQPGIGHGDQSGHSSRESTTFAMKCSRVRIRSVQLAATYCPEKCVPAITGAVRN